MVATLAASTAPADFSPSPRGLSRWTLQVSVRTCVCLYVHVCVWACVCVCAHMLS